MSTTAMAATGGVSHMTSILSRRASLVLGGGAIASAAISAFAVPAAAQQRPNLVKAGTLQVEQVQIAFIGSGNLGGGTLEYQSRRLPIAIGGLGIGGFGLSKITATGIVYNLNKLDDFTGTYGQARWGYALADSSGGKLWLENLDGVVIELAAKREGLAVSLGADAVHISLK
jgi:hypothetical protein